MFWRQECCLFFLFVSALFSNGASSETCACKQHSLSTGEQKQVGATHLRVFREDSQQVGRVTLYHAYAHFPAPSKCVTLSEKSSDSNIPSADVQLSMAKREVDVLKIFADKNAQHVIRLLDSNEPQLGKKVKMMLEFSPGPALRQHWQMLGERRNNLEVVAKVMLSAIACLAEAHTEGAILDVRPENFLCMDAAKPCSLKLIDLSSFQQYTGDDDKQIKATKFVANIFYGSPEMMTHSNGQGAPMVSKKSDIWSFGMMFYAFIYGVKRAHELRKRLNDLAKASSAASIHSDGGININGNTSAEQGEAALLNDANFFADHPAAGGNGHLWDCIVTILKQSLQMNPTERPTAAQIRHKLTLSLENKATKCACGRSEMVDTEWDMVGNTMLRVFMNDLLAFGGGKTYHAYAPKLGKCVALNVDIPDPEASFELHLSEAKRELDVLKLFAHKNAQHVIRLLDSNEPLVYRKEVKMVFELGGPTLKDHWQMLGERRNDPEVVAKVMLSVITCLMEAHTEGAILHVIPENFLCTDKAEPCSLKLINLKSFNKYTGDDDKEIKAINVDYDPLYSSPELLISMLAGTEKVSKKSDIWSFGMMFYAFIYGQEQANGLRNTAEKGEREMAAHLNDANFFADHPVGGNGHLWDCIVGLLKQCLRLNQGERPSAAHIQQQLTKALGKISGDD